MTSPELLTDLAGTSLAHPDAARAFLVVHVDLPDRGSNLVDLPDGVDVTFGRSRGAVVTVDHASVSRLHAAVRRMGEVLEVEDLGSRNGTRVNGDKIDGKRRLVHGDEIAVGPITAVVTITSGLRRLDRIAPAGAGEARLAAELDRAVRYRRPVTVALVRVVGDAGLDLVAALPAADGRARRARRRRAPGDLARARSRGRRGHRASAGRRRARPGRDRHRGLAGRPRGRHLGSRRGRGPARRAAHRQPAAAPPPRRPSSTGPIVIDPAMRKLYAMVERIADAA
jgi:two-component system response regulator AtoC